MTWAPPTPPQRNWTSTMTAVAAGVIVGVVGLVVIAFALAMIGRSPTPYLVTAMLGLAALHLARTRTRKH